MPFTLPQLVSYLNTTPEWVLKKGFDLFYHESYMSRKAHNRNLFLIPNRVVCSKACVPSGYIYAGTIWGELPKMYILSMIELSEACRKERMVIE